MFGNWLEITLLMAVIVAHPPSGCGAGGRVGAHPATRERGARLSAMAR